MIVNKIQKVTLQWEDVEDCGSQCDESPDSESPIKCHHVQRSAPGDINGEFSGSSSCGIGESKSGIHKHLSYSSNGRAKSITLHHTVTVQGRKLQLLHQQCSV